ncbi:Riean_0653 family protein [Pedobacter sp.]
MKTLKIPLLLILFFSLLAACKKEKLTKETQVGANTFSCKINGKVYKRQSDFLSETLTGGLYRSSGNKYKLSVSAVMFRNDKANYVIDVSTSGFMNTGAITLDSENIAGITIISGGVRYVSKPNGQGFINIKFIDTVNGICAGTFEFVVSNINDPNDKIYVTEGRFDVKNNKY